MRLVSITEGIDWMGAIMINRTILQGRLTKDPELRSTTSGISVCSLTVAWSEEYNETKTVLFLDCTAWRKKGEAIAEYFHKGQEIVVEGKLSTRKWETDDEGKRSKIEMTIDNFSFCGPKQTEYSAPQKQDGSDTSAGMEETEEVMPF